ncbi:MAG TPA: HAD-IA family hydrolase, partial [Stellaceae bacterium]|nr:HAD-IA family hydrolase [Stellaceae bacterium]
LAASCGAQDAVDRIRAEAMDPALTTGARTVESFHRDLVRELRYARDWRGFLADWSSHFSVDRAMLDLLERLAAGNRVLLFSNTNAVHWHEVLRMSDGALGRYEAYLSHEIGDMKPRASAFQLVATRAGIEPHRSLFVDDLAENIAAARAVGFHSHLFRGREALERALAAAESSSPSS